PIVVVVEATRPTTQEETHTTWQSCLLSNGYRDAYFDGLNRFFLREDRTDLEACFRTPPNCFDHFQLHAVTSRDEVNASLNSVIASLQARVIAQEATIVKQEATIVGQEATIVGQEATIAGQEATIAGQETTIVGQEATIVDLRHRIEATLERAARLSG